MTASWPLPEFDGLHILWNCAADYGADGEAPEDAPPGVVYLSYLLRIYNSAMSGGLGFAVEVNEEFRLRCAVDAARYLGMVDLAELLEDLIAHYGDGVYAESRDADLESILGRQDEHLEAAFREKAAESPADFGLNWPGQRWQSVERGFILRPHFDATHRTNRGCSCNPGTPDRSSTGAPYMTAAKRRGTQSPLPAAQHPRQICTPIKRFGHGLFHVVLDGRGAHSAS